VVGLTYSSEFFDQPQMSHVPVVMRPAPTTEICVAPNVGASDGFPAMICDARLCRSGLRLSEN
jgi:hypothetical protein